MKWTEAAVLAERIYGADHEEVFVLKDTIGALLVYQGESERGWQARNINLRLLHSFTHSLTHSLTHSFDFNYLNCYFIVR